MMQQTSNNIVNKELWTNERHANFLSHLEESFVRRLMHENNGTLRSIHRVDLRRHVPDTSDSTRDLIIKHRSRRSIEETGPKIRINDVETNTRKSSRRLRKSLQPSMGASQDQVVPQLGNNKSDKDN